MNHDRLSSSHQQPDDQQTGKDPPKQNLQSQSQSQSQSQPPSRDSHYQTNKIMLLDYMEDIASSLPSSQYRSSRQLLSLDNTTSDGNSNSNEIKMEGDVLVDKYLADDLMKLSVEDRNRVSEEINGVFCMAPEETPELIHSSLQKLAIALDAIPFKKKVAYQRSQQSLSSSSSPSSGSNSGSSDDSSSSNNSESSSTTKNNANNHNNNNNDTKKKATTISTTTTATSISTTSTSKITTYVNEEAFRLRFLRAELFDVHLTAIRIVKYLDFVLELFGPYALERPIELSDFTKQEIKYLQMGYIQWMPFRDRSGRRILVQILDSNVVQYAIVRVKFIIYMLYAAGNEDLESQRKGIVMIVWSGGPGTDWKIAHIPDARARHLATIRHEVTAIRYAAYHFCIGDNPILRLIRNFIVFCGGGLSKSRMQFHIGEDIELRYTLQGFGIPVDLIPVTGTGNIKTPHLKQWMNIRKIIETEARDTSSDTTSATKSTNNGNTITQKVAKAKLKSSPSPSPPPSLTSLTSSSSLALSSTSKTSSTSSSMNIVECPGSNDVVFKPGKRSMYHPGNVLFQNLIVSKTEEYTSLASKRNIYKWLAEEIKNQRQGRFLKWNEDGYWTILTDEAQINVKISTSCKAVLSRMKKSTKATNNRTAIESSTYAFKQQQEEEDGTCKRKRSVEKDESDDDNNNNRTSNSNSTISDHRNNSTLTGGNERSPSSTTTTAAAAAAAALKSCNRSINPFSKCND